MGSQFQCYEKFSEENTSLDAPRLSLALSAVPASPEDPSRLLDLTIHRAWDNHDQACIFWWSPHRHGFTPSGFKLLHHATGKFEAADLDLPMQPHLSDTMLVNGLNQFLWELRQGANVRFRVALPEAFRAALIPRENYTLFWPGGKILLWDWGTIDSHLDQELTTQSSRQSNLPRLILPSANLTLSCSRTMQGGVENDMVDQDCWPRKTISRATEPIMSNERIRGAPILDVSLHCPTKVTRNEVFDVVVTVTYSGVADHDEAEPITIHTWAFTALNELEHGIKLYRQNYESWEICEDTEACFRIMDSPPLTVNVGQDDNFASILPGNSWSTLIEIQTSSWSHLPEDTAIGDTFKIAFEGIVVDWWDWKTKEEHMQTRVKLPCWIAGQVIDPLDNENRPKLIVPCTTAAEFSITQ